MTQRRGFRTITTCEVLDRMPLEIFQRIACYVLEIDPDSLPKTTRRQTQGPGPRDLAILSDGRIMGKLRSLQEAYPATISKIAGQTAILNRITGESLAGMAAYMDKWHNQPIMSLFTRMSVRWSYHESSMEAYDAVKTITKRLPPHIKDVFLAIPWRSENDLKSLEGPLSTLRKVKLRFSAPRYRSDAMKSLLKRMGQQAGRKRPLKMSDRSRLVLQDRRYSAKLRKKEFESRRSSLRRTTVDQREPNLSRWALERVALTGRADA